MAKLRNLILRSRMKFQLIFTLITNSYIKGFMNGKIYKGNLKQICVPGLNCYSCMGSLGSCPIGSLQAVVGKNSNMFSFYVVGFLMFIGGIFGRFVCGFMCPFGLFQDLLYKIPFVKKIRTLPKEKFLVKIKYIILIVFVFLMPMFLVNPLGNGNPYFCKYICPVGTLEGGIPLAIANTAIRGAIGFLFYYKLTILMVIIILSIFVYRPFCKILCPLGAIYSIFNKVSLYKYRVDKDLCINCKKCVNTCLMNVNILESENDLECIRCASCRNVCPTNAIKIEFINKKS